MTTQLNNIRDKVRSILERANHPNTPQAEAETALSLAYRLMKKYDLDEHEMAKNSGRHAASDEIKIKTFKITGPYRVRRGSLLYTIAKAVSCHSYRETDVPNHQTVVMVAYGTAKDLFALEALFTADLESAWIRSNHRLVGFVDLLPVGAISVRLVRN